MKILDNHISFLNTILLISFMGLTFYMPFNEFGCSKNQMIGILLIGISFFSDIKTISAQIAFFLSYISASAFPLFGISLHIMTALELLFFVKVFTKRGGTSRIVNVICLATLSQFIPILFFHMPLMELVRLLCNILLFISFVLIYKKDYDNLNIIYLTFALGVLTSCIAGKYYVHPQTEDVYDETLFWVRYCGLWTDPNFLGFFCLAGILSLAKLKINSRIIKIASWVACAVIFYYGTLTMSRTYLVVVVLMIGVYVYRSMKTSVTMLLLSFIFIGVSIPFILDYVDLLQNNRVVGDESTLTAGRIDQTIALLKGQFNDISLIFGGGYNNTEYILKLPGNYYNGLNSHNTYADFILQFGLIGVIWLVLICIKKRRTVIQMISGLTQPYGILMACLVFYLGTLSAAKYEFVFVIAALYYVEFLHNKNGKYEDLRNIHL